MHPFSTSAITFYLLCSTFTNALVMHERSSSEAAAAKTKAISPEVKANVSATINQWLSDIQAVNTFVDTARSCENPKVISSQAATAFKAAQNEGVSNTILQQEVTLDNNGKTAAQALLAQFNIIGPAINDTIFNPNNLVKNLDAINGARCPPPRGAGAISNEGAVQQAAASAVGITVPPPPTPAACNVAPNATN